MKIPAGYWIGWGGQFEQLVSATKKLTIVVPAALLLIFLLLYVSLSSTADALLVFSGVPVPLTGGISNDVDPENLLSFAGKRDCRSTRPHAGIRLRRKDEVCD